MRVRVRVSAPTLAERGAVLRRCRGVLIAFVLTVTGLTAAVLGVFKYPLLINGHNFHTRLPALLVATAISLAVQAGAIAVDYRDRLVRQRRQEGRLPGEVLPGVVFDLPRQRAGEADTKG